MEASPHLNGPKVKEIVPKEFANLSSPQMASYFAYCESPMLKGRGHGVLNTITNLATNTSNGITGTVKREKTYGLQDIESKCKD